MIRHVDPGGRLYTTVGSSNVNLFAHWTTFTGTLNAILPTVQSGGGRVSGSCLRFSGTINGSNYFGLSKTLDAQATWGVAFALKISHIPGVSNQTGYVSIAALYDATTLQVDLRINPDGTLSIYRGTSNLLGTTSFSMYTNTWYHFEWKTTIHPSAGTTELRINGVSKLALTTLNTRASSNSTANIVVIGTALVPNLSIAGWTQDYDDIIIWDTQTNDPNGLVDISDFIGDCGLIVLRPSGAGTTTQFTPDAGSNYARVSETTPDTTTYVESSTTNQIDTYAMDDLPAAATTVKSLAVTQYVRKTDAGSRGMKPMIHVGGSDYTHATEVSLSDSYLYYLNSWGQNPNTSATWTVANVNAFETGQKVSS